MRDWEAESRREANRIKREERQAKLQNVNLFLHALGLDSSQINL